MPAIIDPDYRRISELLHESRKREEEALRLYRPLPYATEFHKSTAFERIARGGNQSSKTSTCAAEFASAMTGTPLHDDEGNELPFRYPTDRSLLAWIIGYDEKHIGGTIYPKLFMPGAFDIIRDRETGKWRVWQPWYKDDAERKAETRPAPPLIPERMIAGWGWEDKAQHVFAICKLRNGNVIRAFSSRGQAAQGPEVDVVWIDEDIEYPGHVAEWRMRLIRRGGRLIWSAWPHSRNDALTRMSKRAEESARDPNASIREWVFWCSKNPYNTPEMLRNVLEGYTDEERRSRDRGEYLFDLVLVFPTFSPEVHCIPSGLGCPRVIEKALAKNNWRPDHTWTHYLVLDPGHTHPGVLLAAVPPPEIDGKPTGDYVVVYRELYGASWDVERLAKEVELIASGTQFEAFIIDYRAGRQRGMTGGATFKQQYSEAFQRHRITSLSTGSSFRDGCDDPAARNMIVRDWLRRRDDGTTKLLLVKHTCPTTIAQFGLYKKHAGKDFIEDKPVDKDNDLMDCLGYLAAHNTRYVHRAETPPELLRSKRIEAMLQRWDQAENPDQEVTYMGPGRPPKSPRGPY